MKITKQDLKDLIKEEMSNIEQNSALNEEALDLGKLEPIVEKGAKDVIAMAKGVSPEEEIQRMVITALIAKLNELIK
jgi:hypothetical protein|tara:strand:+ start:949 stop:1179 length:231 start_codon:yes stop_codon:yes gene_type:complete